VLDDGFGLDELPLEVIDLRMEFIELRMDELHLWSGLDWSVIAA
jgi:hypothetical protein